MVPKGKGTMATCLAAKRVGRYSSIGKQRGLAAQAFLQEVE